MKNTKGIKFKTSKAFSLLKELPNELKSMIFSYLADKDKLALMLTSTEFALWAHDEINKKPPKTPLIDSQIVVGQDYCLYLNDQGELFQSKGWFATVEKVNGLGKIIRVAGGWWHALAINEAGDLFTWGRNWCGSLGQRNGKESKTFTRIENPKLGRVVMVAAGRLHGLAVNEKGDLFVYGPRNECGRPGSTDLLCFFTRVPHMGTIKAVAAAEDYSLVINKKGTLFAGGINYFGCLGNGGRPYKIPFTRISAPGLGKICSIISVGNTHCFVLNEKNELFSAGGNDHGELGHGDRKERNKFTKLNLPAHIGDIVNVCASQYFSASVILDKKGQIFQCGDKTWPLFDNAKRNEYTTTLRNEYTTTFIPIRVPSSIGEIKRVEFIDVRSTTGNVGYAFMRVFNKQGQVFNYGNDRISIKNGAIVKTRDEHPSFQIEKLGLQSNCLKLPTPLYETIKKRMEKQLPSVRLVEGKSKKSNRRRKSKRKSRPT